MREGPWEKQRSDDARREQVGARAEPVSGGFSLWGGADFFSGASSDLRFSPGPSRTLSHDRSKIHTRSNSESTWHGGIFEGF